MSIGKRSSGYFLRNKADGKRYDFKFGTIHLSGNDIYVDSHGDDLCLWFWNTFGNTGGQQITFSFNDLVGLTMGIASTGNSGADVSIKLYIEGHSQDYNKTDYALNHMGGGVADVRNWGNYEPFGCQLFQMPNNPLIEGMSIYNAYFPYKQSSNGKMTYADVTFPYVLPTGTNRVVIGDGYYYNWLNNSPLPVKYILRNYRDLGFSDSGDIAKQQILETYGFPFGPNGEGESTSQGGQGDMTDTTDIVDHDNVTIPQGIKTSGLATVWKLTKTELDKIANYMLDPSFSFSKFRADPMDYIIDLKAMPFNITDVSSKIFTFGGVSFDLTFMPPQCNSFIYDFSMGSVDIPVYFDSFLDYSPFTKGQIYLPYIGMHDINLDLFIGKRIHVDYRVDLLTGCCVATIRDDQRVIDFVQGVVGYEIPLRSKDKNDVLNGLIGAMTSMALQNGYGRTTGLAINLGSALQSSLKPNVSTNNSLASNFGILCNRKPFLIIERPRISLPKAYPETKGYVSKISTTLGNLTGFTQVEDVHLEHVVATEEEKAMIESLLKEGVIL